MEKHLKMCLFRPWRNLGFPLIESFEPVLLSAHGGDLNGFFLLRGEAEKLGEIQRDETFVDLTFEAGYCLEGVGVVHGFIGEGLTDAFSRWSKLVGG